MPNERKGFRCHTHPDCLCEYLAHAVLRQSTVIHPFPLLLIKKERVRATLNFMIIRKLIRALSLVFSTTERRKHVGWSLAAGITNARYHSDSDRQSMRQSHHPVSTSCHRLFIQLTVKIYQKLCMLPRSNEHVNLLSTRTSIRDRGIMLYTSRGATLSLTYFTSDPLVHQRIMTRTRSSG